MSEVIKLPMEHYKPFDCICGNTTCFNYFTYTETQHILKMICTKCGSATIVRFKKEE